MGPLRPHPDNPRYFADATGAPVHLSGLHTWADFATDQGETRFDYEAFLAYLAAHDLNLFRGWVWDLPWSRQGPNGGPFRFRPMPWRRTGPGQATDGEPRFDLTAWDDAWFARLRDRTARAADVGVYVAIMLFQGFGWQFDRTPEDGFPYDGRNNVNGIDCGPGDAAATLEHPAVLAAQDAYVRRVADAVADLPNVLFEVANEAGPASTEWQYHHIRRLRDHLRSIGRFHPVGMTFQFEGGTLAALERSPADWISPDCDPATRADPPVADGRKVIVYDSDHGYDWRSLRRDGPAGYRSWLWRTFCRGANALFMDPWLARIEIDGEVRNAPLGADPADLRFGMALDPFWEPYRGAHGVMRAVSRRVGLARLVPRPELASSGYCLAAPGVEALAYAPPATTALSVDLEPGDYRLAWIDTVTGAVTRERGHVARVADRATFRCPPGEGAALHLLRVR
jgi:hypothetical protein